MVRPASVDATGTPSIVPSTYTSYGDGALTPLLGARACAEETTADASNKRTTLEVAYALVAVSLSEFVKDVGDHADVFGEAGFLDALRLAPEPLEWPQTLYAPGTGTLGGRLGLEGGAGYYAILRDTFAGLFMVSARFGGVVSEPGAFVSLGVGFAFEHPTGRVVPSAYSPVRTPALQKHPVEDRTLSHHVSYFDGLY